jgi:beta-N-acetylhexosaminidase
VEADGSGREDATQARRLRRQHERHERDVRRRRLGALVGLAAVAAVIGAAVGAGSGSQEAQAPEAELPAQCRGADRAGLRTLAGQRLMVRTDGTPDARLRRRAQRGEIAGVIVFPSEGDTTAEIRRGLERLQESAARGGQPPLLVSTDQEGGAVERFPEAPPLRSPAELALSGNESDARLEGRATGTFLARLGINTNLAPVLDVPETDASAIAFRAFGETSAEVERLGLAFADGLAKEGVLATAKHFPGLGRSMLNTDLEPSEITASRRELSQDLRPFLSAAREEVPLIMLGLASYPRIGANGPAALERVVATRLLRTQLGFEGVSITDDLGAEAVASSYGEAEAAERAAAAGVDLLLFAGSSGAEALGRLQAALRSERLDAEDSRASCVRVVALRERLRPTG